MQNALSQQEYVDMSLLIKQQQQGIGYLTSLDDKGRRMVGKVCVLDHLTSILWRKCIASRMKAKR